MNVTYLEHYPHRNGTRNVRFTFPALFLNLIGLIYEENKGNDVNGGIIDELFEDFDDALAAETEKCEYAFQDFICVQYCDSIWKALDTKGYWVGEWEEGSYALCVEGREEQAIKAIARQEMNISLERGGECGDFSF